MADLLCLFLGCNNLRWIKVENLRGFVLLFFLNSLQALAGCLQMMGATGPCVNVSVSILIIWMSHSFDPWAKVEIRQSRDLKKKTKVFLLFCKSFHSPWRFSCNEENLYEDRSWKVHALFVVYGIWHMTYDNVCVGWCLKDGAKSDSLLRDKRSRHTKTLIATDF